MHPLPLNQASIVIILEQAAPVNSQPAAGGTVEKPPGIWYFLPMKRLFLLLLLLVLARAAVDGEVKALLGIHTSKYLFSSDITSLNRQQKSGLAFGLGYAWEIAPKLKLEFQALYGEKGARTSLPYVPGKVVQGTYRNVAIAVPILFSYRFKEGATPYAAMGPEFNVILTHELTIPEYDKIFDLADNTKKIIFALNAALGYELPLGNWALFAELRYNRWLSSLLKSPDATVKSESFSVLIGGIFFL